LLPIAIGKIKRGISLWYLIKDWAMLSAGVPVKNIAQTRCNIASVPFCAIIW
jgi:hypothetical protein